MEGDFDVLYIVFDFYNRVSDERKTVKKKLCCEGIPGVGGDSSHEDAVVSSREYAVHQHPKIIYDTVYDSIKGGIELLLLTARKNDEPAAR